MAITSTTLSGAITSQQTSFGVASATGITAPNNQTGAGITVLQVGQEQMLVTAAPISTSLPVVVRGWNGTSAQAHESGATVLIGTPSDFNNLQEAFTGNPTVVTYIVTGKTNQPGVNLTGTTDAIDATQPGFYVIKTAAVDAMTLAAPAVAAEGNIIEIVSDTLFAHTLTATSLLANGTALKTTATFPAFRGAYLKLRACNLVWEVLSNGASAGIVVLT